MPNETILSPPAHSHETYFLGEKLYSSFIESLSLVGQVERRYSSAVLGIQPPELKQAVEQNGLGEIKSLGDRLSAIFYGQGPHRQKYDQIVSKSLEGHVANDPVKYSALADPDLAKEATGLVRAGMLAQLRQKQLEIARAQRHYEHLDPARRHNKAGPSEATKAASNTDDLILFNHMVRDLIESSAGRKMNLDREKVAEIIKLVMPGDRENAEGVEKGISLEVATKNLLEKLILSAAPEKEVVYGGVQEDKAAGDLILFPGTDHQVYLDVKQTPPNELRRHLRDEQLRAPGSFLKSHSKAILWLGSDAQVGNKFGLPAEFRAVAGELMEELTPQQAVV